jgi:hypothetical protein
MQFQPSEFSYYGQSEVEAPPEVEGAPAPAGGGVADYLQYVPIARDFLLGADPEQEAALIEAKIENLKAQKKKLPALSGFYQNEINKLKSKLTVLKEQAASAKTQTQLLQAGTAVGVGTLVVVGLMAAGGAVWVWRRALKE